MASPTKAIPISPRALRTDTSDVGRSLEEPHSISSPSTASVKLSPTLTRSYDPNDPQNMERQRTMDADFAMQLSRARSASLALGHHPNQSMFQEPVNAAISASGTAPGLSMEDEEDEASYFPSTINEHSSGTTTGIDTPSAIRVAGMDPALMMSYGHDPSLLVTRVDSKLRRSNSEQMIKRPSETNEAPPPFNSSPDPGAGNATGVHRVPGGAYRSQFDFAPLEEFAAEERRRLGITGASEWARGAKRPPTKSTDNGGSTAIADDFSVDATGTTPIAPVELGQRQRRFSQNATQPRRTTGKLALFESANATLPPFDLPPSASPMHMPSPLPMPDITDPGQPISAIPLLPPPVVGYEENKPYRFSFYSNGLRSTIHARSLCELPAEGQSCEDLFLGKNISGAASRKDPKSMPPTSGLPNGAVTPTPFGTPMEGLAGKRDLNRTGGRYSEASPWKDDEDANSWWMDVLCPTDEEMRVLSKCFGIHPLTAEDIQMEETREKIELFRNYYLVCFRSFDQDQYSPTYLEPINYYIVVFREGILSFHFRQSPHPQNVRRRIKQLKDYISVTSDWISYALIDDITDAFGPLIQSIEYEVDSIDELVLILKEAEQSDMLRRIGTCRKKVMGLLRLMGNKADVVKGLAKRCNENWSMAPKSDIGLYLSDIQDHLITMTQSLNHYEKLLSRSHSNYLAQISIEMTDANNQINDVLSRLTALGTILIPMNLVTGLWGMNVHVPGQDDHDTYSWFVGIICCLVAIGGIGGWATYRLMRRSRRRG